MLQRAASNAYSWWWASHIRTKQSKWLEQNLIDVESKVHSTLKIIEQDGDSFAKRAEMYYKKRPELINFVEETYRAYRALAERYDLLSRDLQNANRTIATVFPEQIQLTMDSDDEDSQLGSTIPSPDQSVKSFKTNTSAAKSLPKPPKVPKLPTQSLKAQSLITSRREQLQLRKTINTTAVPANTSGLSKEKALKEIDVMQKDILALQTEKEFVKSSYESGLAKFWEMEGKIIELQGKVYDLQDEFGIGTVIEDQEARNIMASTALKSCAEALNKLQQEQDRSMEEVKTEYQRLSEAYEQLEALKRRERLTGEAKDVEQLRPNNCEEILASSECRDSVKQRMKDQFESSSSLTALELAEKINFEEILASSKCRDSVKQRMKDQFESSSSLTAPELAEKINFEEILASSECRDSVKQRMKDQFKFESSSSLTAPELAEKIDDLVEKIESLQTDLDSQTILVKRLRQYIDDLFEHINNLAENKDGLARELEKTKRILELEEELCKVKGLNRQLVEQNINLNGELTEANSNLDHIKEELKNVKPEEAMHTDVYRQASETEPEEEEKESAFKSQDIVSQSHKQEEEEEKRSESHTADSTSEADLHELRLTEEDGINWRQLYLNNIEERERILVEEYTMILRDYKDVKIKLSEAEKKNRNNVFELATHTRELRNTITSKDEDIKLLRRKLAALLGVSEENLDLKSQEFESPCNQQQQKRHERKPSDLDKQPLFHHLYDPKAGIIPRGESAEEDQVSVLSSPQPLSTVEARLRSELNNLLEGNLDFWLRFSTTFHQIHKFQTSIKDLQSELAKLKEANKNDNSQQLNLQSEARPLYKHLREIQTEMTLWLEHSSVFQDELGSRLSSLDKIQQEIAKVSHNSEKKKHDVPELGDFQAAKFQGEVVNMKQENSKVAEELQAGVHRITGLQTEIEKAMMDLDREFKLTSKSQKSRPRIPLHSFLFGAKLRKKHKRQSMFACVSPQLDRQHSGNFNDMPS